MTYHYILPLLFVVASITPVHADIVYESTTAIGDSTFTLTPDTHIGFEGIAAGTDRSDPTVTLSVFDLVVGDRTLTASLWLGDGAVSEVPAAPIATVTFTYDPTSTSPFAPEPMSFTFTGATLPDEFIITLELDDADAFGGSSFGVILDTITPTATTTGTFVAGHFSTDDAASWTAAATFTTSGTSISAVPEPSSMVLIGLAGLCVFARRRASADTPR